MSMHIGGVEIEQSKGIKLFGVNIDCDLNFITHIIEM